MEAIFCRILNKKLSKINLDRKRISISLALTEGQIAKTTIFTERLVRSKIKKSVLAGSRNRLT